MSVSVTNPGTNAVVVRSPGGATSAEAGPAGRSAYDLAVSQGFVGTLAEWLDSLHGAPGVPGDAIAFEHVQSTPSASWSIDIPPEMNRRPNVSIYVDDILVLSDVQANETSVNITFPSPVTGSAVLS